MTKIYLIIRLVTFFFSLNAIRIRTHDKKRKEEEEKKMRVKAR